MRGTLPEPQPCGADTCAHELTEPGNLLLRVVLVEDRDGLFEILIGHTGEVVVAPINDELMSVAGRVEVLLFGHGRVPFMLAGWYTSSITPTHGGLSGPRRGLGAIGTPI